MEKSKIAQWQEAIETWQEFIKKKVGTAKKRKQWQEGIEAYQDLIKEMQSKKMNIGGVVEVFGNPMIAQGMQGELSGFGTSSPLMTF